jgi:phosphoglycolate phosphatase
MKPHPEMVHRALTTLGIRPHQTLLIGDSVTDIEVCRLVGVRSVGYAKTPFRGDELRGAGADVIVDDMTLVSRLRRLTDPSDR